MACVNKKRILGECLLISSLPGKGLSMRVELRGMPSNSTCILEAVPGKLDIKRRKPGILFISIIRTRTIKFDLIIDFCINSAS